MTLTAGVDNLKLKQNN